MFFSKSSVSEETNSRQLSWWQGTHALVKTSGEEGACPLLLYEKGQLFYNDVIASPNSSGSKCYIIYLNLLISFKMDLGMENTVCAFTQFYAGKIWDIGRHKLQACGMHQSLFVLDTLCIFLISKMLVFVLLKIPAAVYNQDNVKALKRNITYYFRKLMLVPPHTSVCGLISPYEASLCLYNLVNDYKTTWHNIFMRWYPVRNSKRRLWLPLYI